MSSGAVGKAISNIHSGIKRSLKYITNPEKTEGELLVSGINCYTPDNFIETVEDFKEIYNQFSKNKRINSKSIAAHHYLISFDPHDKITAQKAHELSREVIDKFLKGEHQAVLATHIDKKNIHTHVIFNTYNKNTGKKYESSPEKLREFKKVINEVCLEHNLNLINKPKRDKSVNLTYKDWMIKNNISEDKKLERFKFIRAAIDHVLKNTQVKSFDKLTKLLKQQYGLTLIYKNYKTNMLYKNITFKSNDWDRGIRGKYDISLENITARLEGRDTQISKFEEYCIENNTNDYKGYIKSSVDFELKNNIGIAKVEDLADILKSKYNIEMKFLSAKGLYLKRFKFRALESSQRNYIGSSSLDKENREDYELSGIKNRILKIQNITFGNDIRENLKILNNNLLISGKPDKWGISTGLNYMTKSNLKTSNDIDIRRTQISTLKSERETAIDKINKYINKMQLIYSRLQKKIIEIKSLEKSASELGFFKGKRKREIASNIEKIKASIKQLKQSEFYQTDIKYSEKFEQLNLEKQNYTERLKEDDRESSLLYKIETIDKSKQKILESLELEQPKNQKEKDKNLKKNLEINI